MMKRNLFFLISLIFQCLFFTPFISAQTQPCAEINCVDNRILMEFPMRYMGRELLISSCISRSTHYKWMEVGSRPFTTHARMEYKDGKIYLRQINSNLFTNEDDLSQKQAISDSHMDAYLANIPIQCFTADSSAVVLDVTNLFMKDNVLQVFPWHFSKARMVLKPELCSFISAKAFADNFSVKTLMSYDYTPKGDERPGVCSAEVVRSILLMPEAKMNPRLTDSRLGLFTQRKTNLDFAQSDFYRPLTYVQRWRLEPSDMEAWQSGELVPPLQPIVYYVDSGFPEAWKEPIKKGILKWNEAFAKIGFMDAVQARDYPNDDPEFDEDNLKYSCIRYIATDRGAAQGPSWVDPSTGEILCASVYVWSALPEIMNRNCFVQTAQANPSIRAGRMSEEDLSTAIESILIHEIGHTLGLAHNMGGSSAYSIDSLLNADFVKRKGISASIMDYCHFNYVVPPGETDVPLLPAYLGPYDELCIEYLYQPVLGAVDIYDDQQCAERWIDTHAGDPCYRYGIQQWRNKYDPSSLINDVGDDALRAGDMSIANLKYVLDNMEGWLAGGDNVGQRLDMYNELVKHYGTLLKNSLYNVGGIYLSFVKEDTPGEVYSAVPHQRQKEALKWVAREVRQSAWIDKRELTSKFEVAVDASAKVQAEIAAELIAVAENVELSSHLAIQPYAILEYMDDLYELFFESTTKGELSQTDKVLQRSLLQQMIKNSAALKAPSKNLTASLGYRDDVEESATAFGLRKDGGYIYNIPLNNISEREACFYVAIERIHKLAISKLKKCPETEKPHWIMLRELSKPVLN